MLASDGVVATQATVSRDLEDLGAVKVRIPGGAMAYAIPEHAKEGSAPDDHLRRVMGEFVVEVAYSANIVVLRTPPGSAHVVASAVDRAGLADVLGTVAGDDTIMVVCSEHAGGAQMAAELGGLAGLVGEECQQSCQSIVVCWRTRVARRWPPSSAASPVCRRSVSSHAQACGSGVFRWPRHVGRGEVDRRGVGLRGRSRCRSTSARPPTTTGTPSATARSPPVRWKRSSSTPSASSPTTTSRPIIRANALYEGKYPLVSALSRPVIARHLVRAAREFNADAVAHGCTGKGNDQVRFEVSVRALAPDLDVLAPVRVWGFTREDSIDYAARHDIPIKVRKDSPFSIDENLWGRAIECGVLEDPWAAPPGRDLRAHRQPERPRARSVGAGRGLRAGGPGLARR